MLDDSMVVELRVPDFPWRGPLKFHVSDMLQNLEEVKTDFGKANARLKFFYWLFIFAFPVLMFASLLLGTVGVGSTIEGESEEKQRNKIIGMGLAWFCVCGVYIIGSTLLYHCFLGHLCIRSWVGDALPEDADWEITEGEKSCICLSRAVSKVTYRGAILRRTKMIDILQDEFRRDLESGKRQKPESDSEESTRLGTKKKDSLIITKKKDSLMPRDRARQAIASLAITRPDEAVLSNDAMFDLHVNNMEGEQENLHEIRGMEHVESAPLSVQPRLAGSHRTGSGGTSMMHTARSFAHTIRHQDEIQAENEEFEEVTATVLLDQQQHSSMRPELSLTARREERQNVPQVLREPARFASAQHEREEPHASTNTAQTGQHSSLMRGEASEFSHASSSLFGQHSSTMRQTCSFSRAQDRGRAVERDRSKARSPANGIPQMLSSRVLRQ
eukprot:2616145-Rhodomonas_salina.1